MKRKQGCATAAALLAVALSACSNSDDDTLQVDELASGSYTVSVGDVAAPKFGRYYAGNDGSHVLVLVDSDEHANQLYRRDTSGHWQAVPKAHGEVRVLNSTARSASAITTAALSGDYQTQIDGSIVASFSVQADGTIVPGASSCKLGGTLAASTVPGTLKLTLTAAACGSLPASSGGLLIVDADDAPAQFRLIADNGTALVDLWAFAD